MAEVFLEGAQPSWWPLTNTITAGTMVNYAWSFGDGSTGSGPNPLHTYPNIGVYTAVVTASNTSNMVTASTVVTIETDSWSIYLPTVVKPVNNANQTTQPEPFAQKSLNTYRLDKVALIPRWTASHYLITAD